MPGAVSARDDVISNLHDSGNRPIPCCDRGEAWRLTGLVMQGGRLIAFGPTATTLTSALVQAAFEVDACVSGARDRNAIVDFVPSPSDPGREQAWGR